MENPHFTIGSSYLLQRKKVNLYVTSAKKKCDLFIFPFCFLLFDKRWEKNSFALWLLLKESPSAGKGRAHTETQCSKEGWLVSVCVSVGLVTHSRTLVILFVRTYIHRYFPCARKCRKSKNKRIVNEFHLKTSPFHFPPSEWCELF